MDIRRVLERASRDEPSYICLPEHANLFTKTKLVPEIYTKDEINEMFNGEIKQDIARIQHATDVARSSSIDRDQHTSIDVRQHTSIDNRMQTSVDENPPRPHTMKSQENFHTREEIDQLVEEIYRALETTEERLDGRCDDIYFPMDLSINEYPLARASMASYSGGTPVRGGLCRRGRRNLDDPLSPVPGGQHPPGRP
ncbi:hypothetical protein F2Q68_00021110 [Brassica cretica]|uniref:Uncharacterized protein n=1 Tax=Brassica cretica TaxID=69181 RepID=A0A8S9G821_BRACR|nr:hypothetical protein F2Q68_00021110 [Brassica cretica]